MTFQVGSWRKECTGLLRTAGRKQKTSSKYHPESNKRAHTGQLHAEKRLQRAKLTLGDRVEIGGYLRKGCVVGKGCLDGAGENFLGATVKVFILAEVWVTTVNAFVNTVMIIRAVHQK